MLERFLSKEESLAELATRRANPPAQIDNAALYAGSPMYYYCVSCWHVADIKPEDWFLEPSHKLCDFCRLMTQYGWLLS